MEYCDKCMDMWWQSSTCELKRGEALFNEHEMSRKSLDREDTERSSSSSRTTSRKCASWLEFKTSPVPTNKKETLQSTYRRIGRHLVVIQFVLLSVALIQVWLRRRKGLSLRRWGLNMNGIRSGFCGWGKTIKCNFIQMNIPIDCSVKINRNKKAESKRN
jgi:hypothetical protein